MKKKLSPPNQLYRGRFAPSPTGPLHFGSLVAALGSYLDAKSNNGIWLVRVEDLDTPRCSAVAVDDILRTLDIYGLHSDEAIILQSQRTSIYEEALQVLQLNQHAYPCCCTRKEIADSALLGIEGPVYPGTCRNGIPAGRDAKAWRVRTHQNVIAFTDAIQGHISQDLEHEVGDFIVKRADGYFAYQLAVVVDDAYQDINHIVRGADLLLSTPRQIHLHKLLGLATPSYMHLPVVTNSQGEKLSKQTLATAISKKNVSATLCEALIFLGQHPPVALRTYQVNEILAWAVAHWRPPTLLN